MRPDRGGQRDRGVHLEWDAETPEKNRCQPNHHREGCWSADVRNANERDHDRGANIAFLGRGEASDEHVPTSAVTREDPNERTELEVRKERGLRGYQSKQPG